MARKKTQKLLAAVMAVSMTTTMASVSALADYEEGTGTETGASVSAPADGQEQSGDQDQGGQEENTQEPATEEETPAAPEEEGQPEEAQPEEQEPEEQEGQESQDQPESQPEESVAAFEQASAVPVVEEVEEAVAKIGDQTFDTLNKAVQAVMNGEASGVIDLYQDQELMVNFIQPDTKVTINGNGCQVDIPKQTLTAAGDLTIWGKLTFRNTKVFFGEGREGGENQWAATIASNGSLNLEEGTQCHFTNYGIYASPNANINVNASTLKLENMTYTAMMAESYANLNVVNGSEFLLSDAMKINGLTCFTIRVNDSSFTVKDCERQGLTRCSLTLENRATALLENDDIGYNMHNGARVCEVNEGTTLTIRNCAHRALMSMNSGSVVVKDGGNFIVTGNGYGYSAGNEAFLSPEKGAITMGVYGWDG